MANLLLINQIETMIISLQTFLRGCQMAAKKDDGKISKEEQKQLDQIQKATEEYIKKLKKIISK